MAIVTVRPDNTYVNTMVLTGAASAHAAANDNSDGSYVTAPQNQFSEVIYDLSNTVIPAGAFIRQVRVRVRYSTVSYFFGSSVYWVVRFIDTTAGYYGPSQAYATLQSSPVEQVGGWQTVSPSGAPWTQTDLDNLQVDIYPGYYSGFVQYPRVYEVYVDIDYNLTPTTSITSPGNNTTVSVTRPPVYFTYSDTEGDAMEGYRAKLYSSDQYNAGGFDPNTTGAIYDTGKVGSYSPPPSGITPPFDLLNNTSYRWYIWVYQSGGPSGTTGFGVSNAASTTFTLDVTPPAIPVLTPTVNDTTGFVSLLVASGGGSPATFIITVERSQDGGGTWSVVRGSPVVPGTTISDFEVIPNKAVVYRARATAANNIASVWSVPTTAITILDNEWRLRDPLDSTRNIVLSVIGENVTHRIPEDKALFSPMGRTRKVSVTDVIKGYESDLNLEFLTETAWKAFELLRNSQRTLFLTRGWTGEAWYIQFDQMLEMTLHNYAPTYRTCTISWVEVDAP